MVELSAWEGGRRRRDTRHRGEQVISSLSKVLESQRDFSVTFLFRRKITVVEGKK